MEFKGSEQIPAEKFSSPEEELAFLRERIANLETEKPNESIEQNTQEVLRDYAEVEPEEVLHEVAQVAKEEIDQRVLELAPEEHDVQMAELIVFLRQKGIRNVFSLLTKMQNPHIEDDFHRYMVEYIKEGFPAPGVKEGGPVWKAVHKTLFEVSVAMQGEQDVQQKTLEQLMASMQQFYAGMLTISSGKEKNELSLEIATSVDQQHAVFYVSVPDRFKDVFEKQLLSIFPNARVTENKNDYNIFNETGIAVGAYAKLDKHEAFPIKTYEEFEHDPLNVLLSAFAKLQTEGEGAAIQMIFRPAGDHNGHFRKILEKIKKGTKTKEALAMPESMAGEVAQGIHGLFFQGKKKEADSMQPKHVDEIAVEQIGKKIAEQTVETNIRLVASAGDETRAENILADLKAGFRQFEQAQGNTFTFKDAKGRSNKEFFRNFSYRDYNEKQRARLNLKEMATVYHLPLTQMTTSRELKSASSKSVPAPIEIATEGVVIGVNRYSTAETPIHFAKEDRVRHFYEIGQTGTGKTVLIKNMIVQDIENGDGVCMIDPHGSDIQDILGQVPPERYDDVIYFDPSHTPRPMALNMLEYDARYPEQKTFVVNEMMSIFNKLFDMATAGGPMFEQYFRNATMLVIEDQESGSTLLDVSRVLADKTYRDMKIAKCKNPLVVQFWTEIAGKAGGEAKLENIVPYITSKFDVFLSNEIMRPIVSQQKSSFNFREIMDQRKILLVNLAKGRLGEINANLLGLIIVGKILMAALSRVDTLGKGELHDFYLYIDEFQNVTTDSIAQILSEARKYRLSLNIAHQFIAQLSDEIRDAVFGNVGSMCAFRVGADDAKYLESQFAPTFSAEDLMNIDNWNGVINMLAHGKPIKPFNIATYPPGKPDMAVVEQLKKMSFEKYGRPREEVEAEIMKKYEKMSAPKKKPPAAPLGGKSAVPKPPAPPRPPVPPRPQAPAAQPPQPPQPPKPTVPQPPSPTPAPTQPQQQTPTPQAPTPAPPPAPVQPPQPTPQPSQQEPQAPKPPGTHRPLAPGADPFSPPPPGQ